MKIVFMGTPYFGAVSLKKLINHKVYIACVVTQPDRPAGRNRKITFSPVKQIALENNLRIFQPEKLDDEFKKILIKQDFDIIVVVAYGKILPKWLLELGKYRPVNVHASLLPKYRGADPIRKPIMEGQKVAGVTTMNIVYELDAGDILEQTELEILKNDNYGTMLEKLANAGADLLVFTINKLEKNEIIPKKQDDSLATYTSKLTKEETIINWSKPAGEIFNLIRALSPIPGAITIWQGKKLKIYNLSKTNLMPKREGEISIIDGKLFVSSKNSMLEVLELQLEGKKQMKTDEFLRGNRIREGDFFK